MAADTYAIITDRIIDALERGAVPWRRPWTARPGTAHQSAVSHKTYRGINPLVLGITAVLEGYSDPRWITFKQALGMSGAVRKGEHGTPVVFWKWLDRADDAETEPRARVPMLRRYTVFNVAQCDGLDLPPLETAPGESPPPIDAADQIVAGYDGGPSIAYDGGDRAFYVPTRDSFHDAHGYYATLFHELGHSTGHPSRLERKTNAEAAPFGSATYSREELVAEFTAAFLCNATGIENVDPSAAYVASWLRVLRGDKRIAVQAAAQAQKAADWICGERGTPTATHS